MALVGAILIGMSSLTGLSGDVAGDLLALAGAACMAGHWLCSRYARRTVEALPYTYLVYGRPRCSWALMAPLTGGFQLTPASLWYILGLAAGSTLLGHLLFTVALGKVSATVVSFALLGEPVGAMLWSMLMFGEIPTPLLLLGGAGGAGGAGAVFLGQPAAFPGKVSFLPATGCYKNFGKCGRGRSLSRFRLSPRFSLAAKKAVASLSPHAGM